MISSSIKERIGIAILVIVYNLVGLITICSLYGSDPLYGDWVIFTLIFTFPIIGISFMYRFIEADHLLPVYIIQSIMLLSTLIIADWIARKKLAD